MNPYEQYNETNSPDEPNLIHTNSPMGINPNSQT